MGAGWKRPTVHNHSFPQDLRWDLYLVCRWICLVARAVKWGRAGVPVPRPLAQEAQVADPSPGIRELRHTRRCGPALPHRPPTPEALRLPQHWKNLPLSPPREAPRGPNCLRRRRVGGAFSPDSPHLLSGYALKSFLVAPLPAAPVGAGAPSGGLYSPADAGPCVTKPLPPVEGPPPRRKEAEPRRPQPMGSRRGQRLELRWAGAPRVF